VGVFGRTGATAIAVDANGAVVIVGNTTANQLPVTSGALGQQCQCLDSIQVGFIAKLLPGRVQWATYLPLAESGLPRESDISINALALATNGDVVIGGTAPSGFPVTKGALQTIYPGGNPLPTNTRYAGFISRIQSLGQRLVFSTFFGGNVALPSAPNGVMALGVDPQGNIWATGGSVPAELPLPSDVPALGET